MAAVTVDKKNYRPTKKEPFMSERQRDYFRLKLLVWKDDILKERKETLAHLQADSNTLPISPTAPPPRPTAPSNFAPATASAS